ncbi:VP3 [Haloarcula californiae icosahedral virus 1]|uniref:VP3 n=1 Tax=Haloarcula californiae icosahedral virus 1 TaxID=1735722 RepID=A0A1C7A3R8_9VIRU|nr:VP3 [Haloarcula californiae icosahedral virus 1]ALJ99691.1 VP3 [Haloarcula californiae icosahedral virus 1]
MTTVAEKTADTATLLDDLAATMTGHSSGNYADADADVTNSGGTGDWYNNARVIEHTPSGQYLTFYIKNTGDPWNNNQIKGIAFVVSNDWDSTNDHPAGKTTTSNDDPFSGDVGNDRDASFSNTDISASQYHHPDGLFYYSDNSGGTVDNRTDEVSYFISVGANYFNVAAWNTSDGNYGACGVLSFEYVDNKFWNDGNDPWAFFCASSYDNVDGGTEAYGWSHYCSNNNDPNPEHPYSVNGFGFDNGEWGVVNPDSNDDTFFFRRPVIYETSSKNVPVAYVEDIISNDRQEGASHGDIVTHNGVDYQMLRQSGGGEGTPLTYGLRYE